MAAAADAESLDDLFLRLETAGVMLRIDRDVIPTMAKTPTLGPWELDLLRTIEHVVRLGLAHLQDAQLQVFGSRRVLELHRDHGWGEAATELSTFGLGHWFSRS